MHKEPQYIGNPDIQGTPIYREPQYIGTPIYREPQYIGNPNIQGTPIYREPRYIGNPDIQGTPINREPQYIGNPDIQGRVRDGQQKCMDQDAIKEIKRHYLETIQTRHIVGVYLLLRTFCVKCCGHGDSKRNSFTYCSLNQYKISFTNTLNAAHYIHHFLYCKQRSYNALFSTCTPQR